MHAFNYLLLMGKLLKLSDLKKLVSVRCQNFRHYFLLCPDRRYPPVERRYSNAVSNFGHLLCF